MKNRKTKLALIGAAIAATVLLSAGSCDTGKMGQSYTDAPVNKTVDYSEAKIIAFPDGFSNVATKCDENGNRIYVLFKGDAAYGSLQVVADDPSCS